MNCGWLIRFNRSVFIALVLSQSSLGEQAEEELIADSMMTSAPVVTVDVDADVVVTVLVVVDNDMTVDVVVEVTVLVPM
jgi:hypothetical protein